MQVLYSQSRLHVKRPTLTGGDTTVFLLREDGRVVVRGAFHEVMDRLRAACPGGRFRDLRTREDVVAMGDINLARKQSSSDQDVDAEATTELRQ